MLKKSDEIAEVIETDTPFGQKVDFSVVLMRQIQTITYFLSRLNETPPYIWTAYGKPETNFDPEKIKPNRDNFVFAVIALKILLTPYFPKWYKEWESQIKKDEKMQKDPIGLARIRFQKLMLALAEKNLLPIMVLD